MIGEVQIDLGPLPAGGVRSFVSFARPEIERLAADPVLSLTFTPSITASIAALLETWDEAAHQEPFVWSGPMSTEHAEYILYALFLAVEHRRDQRGGPATGTDVATRRPFVIHVIDRFMSVLRAAPDADHSRLEHLAERWPADLRT